MKWEMFKRIKLSKSFCWGILVSSFTWLVTIYLYVHVASDNESTPSLPTSSVTETFQSNRLIPYSLKRTSNINVGLRPNTSYIRTRKQEFLKLSNVPGKCSFISILKNHFHRRWSEDGPVIVVSLLVIWFVCIRILHHLPLYLRYIWRWWTCFVCRSAYSS